MPHYVGYGVVVVSDKWGDSSLKDKQNGTIPESQIFKQLDPRGSLGKLET